MMASSKWFVLAQAISSLWTLVLFLCTTAFCSSHSTLLRVTSNHILSLPSVLGERLAKLFFDGRMIATHVNPGYVALAKSFGIEAYCCERVDELPVVIDKFVNATGPILVDFKVVPDICLPMVAPGKGLDEMFLPGEISVDDDEGAKEAAAQMDTSSNQPL